MLLDILISLLGVAADQLVKYWACVRLKPVETLPVVREVFHLTYCENRGAAFSLFSGKRWLLLLITAVLLAGILYAMKKQWVRGGLGRWGLRLILGGALGNLIDRLLRGYVVDLFDFRLIRFPIFNVADILLNVGVGLLVIYILFIEPRLNKKEGDRGAEASDRRP